MRPPSEEEVQERPLELRKAHTRLPSSRPKKKTIVLSRDRTFIHSFRQTIEGWSSENAVKSVGCDRRLLKTFFITLPSDAVIG